MGSQEANIEKELGAKLFLRACSVTRVQLLANRGLKPARLLRSWGSPGKHTKVGCHFLLQRTFLTQGANPHLLCLLPWQADSLPLSHLGSPKSLLGINMFESKGKEAGLVRSNQAFWFAGMSASWHAELVVLKPEHSQASWGG